VRWSAIGAAVAITLGGGGLLTTSASVDSGNRSIFVPITPCRLMDTRPGTDNIGPRSTPIGAGESYIAHVTGVNGNCTIPATATAVSMNVTIITPTSASFLTIWPADQPKPLTANQNWIANQPPTPNAVTVALSTTATAPATATGQIGIYNLAGTVNIAADIVGYYDTHTHDDRYYTKAQTDQKIAAIPPGATPGPTGPTGPAGPTGAGTNGFATRNVVGAWKSQFFSIALGSDGLPIAVYRERTSFGLSVTHCGSRICSESQTTALPGSGGSLPSIAIGVDGLPVVAYFLEGAPSQLVVSHCVDVGCTSPPTVTFVDTFTDVPTSLSLAISSAGLPIVVAGLAPSGASTRLRFVGCANVACTSSTATTIDTVAALVNGMDMVTGADGFPIIIYREVGSIGSLTALHCTSVVCSSHDPVVTLGPAGGLDASIAVGVDGRPIIALYDFAADDLVVAHCDDAICSSATRHIVDQDGGGGARASLVIGVDGLPIIAYTTDTASLRVARCADIGCSAPASIVVVDSPVDVGVAIDLGADGLPVLVYSMYFANATKVVKCGDVTCRPILPG